MCRPSKQQVVSAATAYHNVAHELGTHRQRKSLHAQ
uniref:Uncharacterized protein n=1 Tax=Anguilla anguilla TaxID=7936 RepID=A0A0E9SXE4_ANGAN